MHFKSFSLSPVWFYEDGGESVDELTSSYDCQEQEPEIEEEVELLVPNVGG